MPVRAMRDGALTIKSADSTPKTQVVAFLEGGLSWTEHPQSAVIHRDRGALDHARKGSEQPLEGAFSFRYQDADIRTALVDMTFGLAGAGARSYAQPLYAGWLNPQTDATVKAGATLFGRTIKAGDVIGGSVQRAGGGSDAGGPNLLFEIDDPTTGNVGESVLFLAARVTEVSFKEGEEFNELTATFRSAVKQPHIY